MAAKKLDAKELVEQRLRTVDGNVDGLVPGSEEHSRAINDELKLVQAIAELEKNRITEEDNTAKREEQKRMNDEELANKANQTAIDVERLEMERKWKWNQCKMDIFNIVSDRLIRGFALGGRMAYTGRIMRNEYALTGGESLIPPNNLARSLDKIDPYIGKK